MKALHQQVDELIERLTRFSSNSHEWEITTGIGRRGGGYGGWASEYGILPTTPKHTHIRIQT